MLNQSFSAENFEKIFNILNRKGEIKKDFFPESYIDKSIKIKELRLRIKNLKSQYKNELIDKAKFNEEKDNTEIQVKQLIKDKEDIIYNHLKNISNEVNTCKDLFKFEIRDRRGKSTYELDKTDEAQFYAVKQLQYNIRKTFGVKQSDRYSILKQLKQLLEDGLPKIIIRTDIKSFYESIPQDELKDKIENNTLLTYQSKQFISSILDKYESLKCNSIISQKVGIPRGIGISAYLAELYMRDIDQRIKAVHNVTYYARYVDDIIIIITPTSKFDDYNYLEDVTKIIEHGKLNLNSNKTTNDFIDRVNDDNNGKNVQVSYLGYKFNINHSLKRVKLSVQLSDDKKKRYKDRISRSINDYNISSRTNERLARKLLYKRLWFITGNTNLINSKKGIKTGVYYSNSLLTKLEAKTEFRDLDSYLKSRLMRIEPYDKLCFDRDKFKQHLISKFSFTSGFNDLKFHAFSKDDFREIKQIWDEE